MTKFALPNLCMTILLLAAPPLAPSAEPPGSGNDAVRTEREPFRLRVKRSRHMWLMTSPGRSGLPPLEGGVDDGDPTIERPLWIPSGAYTNGEMIAYYGIGIGKWRKSMKLSEEKTSRTTLGRSVMQFWRGDRPMACVVEVKPKADGPPGSFVFRTLGHSTGPRGWLQDTGIKDEIGFQYRFWFDQPRTPAPESLRDPTTEGRNKTAPQ